MSAFPNVWKDQQTQQTQRQSSRGSVNESNVGPSTNDDRQALTKLQFQYVGVDGKRYTTSSTKASEICLLCCCPCFAGDMCGEDRKQQYKSCFITFCFFIMVVQFIMLIIELSIGGFDFTTPNYFLGPDGCTFELLGAKDTCLIVEKYHIFRLITPVFLHGGIIHLILNVFAEIRFGLYLEQRWGTLRFIVLYFVSSVVGIIASCVSRPDALSVGASAALMGLLGAHTVEIICKWHKTNPMESKLSLIQMILWIVIVLLFGLSPYVDAAAHLGGLICGALVGLSYFVWETNWNRILKIVLTILSIGIILVFSIISLVVMWTILNPSCNAATVCGFYP